MRGDTLMRAALALAARGMAVFPLRPGTKRPAVQRDWEGCATTDVEQIERWWARAPYNIGVATGPSKLVVVDLDAPHGQGRHGRQVLADIAREAGADVPRETFTVVTPGGGQHLYFSAPTGPGLTNTAGRIGPSIDTRAVGGYVVGPGSRIDGRAYRLVKDADTVALPPWLLTRLRPDPIGRPPVPVAASSAYVEAAVRNEVRRVSEAVPGRRNMVLFQAAAKLARFVAGGRLADDDVRSSLAAACASHLGAAGFSTREVERTIESGLRRSRTRDAYRPRASCERQEAARRLQP